MKRKLLFSSGASPPFYLINKHQPAQQKQADKAKKAAARPASVTIKPIIYIYNH